MTEASQNTALVDGLLRPEAYPWQPASVELVQTHVSWVFLAGERVVKVKKPVGYGFVDHTTLESRRRSCADEVRLNRRLTDGVYLDVAPIVRDGTGYRVAAEGEPVEWATLMHRLPADKMLDVLGRRYGRRTASRERSRSSPGEHQKRAPTGRQPLLCRSSICSRENRPKGVFTRCFKGRAPPARRAIFVPTQHHTYAGPSTVRSLKDHLQNNLKEPSPYRFDSRSLRRLVVNLGYLTTPVRLLALG